MARNPKTAAEAGAHEELLKKLLMLELCKLGVSQGTIAKKLKLSTVTVNAFLKGINKPE